MAEENGGVAPAPEVEAASPREVKSGICPYCLVEKGGLVWNFFQNMMQLGGRIMHVAYATCSCQACGKLLSQSIIDFREADVQPQDGPQLIHRGGGWPSSRRHRY